MDLVKMDKTTQKQVNFQLESLNDKSRNKYTLDRNAQGWKLWHNGYEVTKLRCKSLTEVWMILNTINRYKARELEALKTNKLVFEERGVKMGMRLVSNRVLTRGKLAMRSYTSVAFEVSRHAQYDNEYTIHTYLYSAPEKIEGVIDPCYGGYIDFHHDGKTAHFPTYQLAFEYLETKYGYETEVKQ